MYPYIFVSTLGSYEMGRHKLYYIILQYFFFFGGGGGCNDGFPQQREGGEVGLRAHHT